MGEGLGNQYNSQYSLEVYYINMREKKWRSYNTQSHGEEVLSIPLQRFERAKARVHCRIMSYFASTENREGDRGRERKCYIRQSSICNTILIL